MVRIFSIQGFWLSNSSIDMVSTLGSVHDITILKMAIIDKVYYIDIGPTLKESYN